MCVIDKDSSSDNCLKSAVALRTVSDKTDPTQFEIGNFDFISFKFKCISTSTND